jgi:hypothetical protein
MISFRKNLAAITAFVIMGSMAICADAQAPDQSAPIPAYQPGSGDTDQNAPQQYQSLSGVQNLSLGEAPQRSYWQPHFNVFGTADSNEQETAQGDNNWTTWTSISAGLDVHKLSGRSNFTLNYAGGGMFSNGNNVATGDTQQAGVTERYSFRRAAISVFDQFDVLPESSLGFGGLGAATLPTNGTTQTGTTFDPGSVVLTGRGQEISNNSGAELDTFLTPRASLTFAGGYSLLHYFNNGLLDYQGADARVGYNYQLTRRNTLALIYSYSDFNYSSASQSAAAHTMQLSYGRVITGKLAFQVAAGPQAILSAFTITPSTGPTGQTVKVSSTDISWSLNSSFQYQRRRYGLAASYNHGVNGGSGVLSGARTDVATGSITRQMSRTVSSGLVAGYSRNQGLPGPGAQANQLYSYWFGGINLSKPIGSTWALTLSYQAQYQKANADACVGPTCGTNVLRHLISVGLGWNERPLLF